jgi:BirA family biotin operon repressor/biotin-[acetyl-CoA-carboxylase] ligase
VPAADLAGVGARYEGLDGAGLAALLDLPAVFPFARISSTMDEAHRLAAAGAAAGTLVIADAQTAGRGRGGRAWTSRGGSGLFFTLVERPNDPDALEVLSLRLGLRLAERLDRFATLPIALKWPNDLQLAGGKLAGILVEARWRDGRPDWVAIGIGINLVAPADLPAAAGLASGVGRLELLAEVAPAIRGAAAARGRLSDDELTRYAARDVAAGRLCEAPVPGRVRGISAGGELLVETAAGVVPCRAGSLVLTEERT